jgi:hypothetical protein
MSALMTAVADIVQGIAGFMGLNMTAGAAVEGDMEAWYFALGGMMDQIFGNLSGLMDGLGEILGIIAGLFA